MLAEAARTGAWEPVLRETPRLRAALRRDVPITPRGHLEEARLRWRRLCAPPGVSIGLAGGDPKLLSAITARLEATFGSVFYHFRALDLGEHRGQTPTGRWWRLVRRAVANFGPRRLDLGRATLLVSQSRALEAPPGRAPVQGADTGLAEVFVVPVDIGFLYAPPDNVAPEAGTAPVVSPPRGEAGRGLPRPWARVEPRGSTEEIVRETEMRLVEFLANRVRRRLAMAVR